MLSLLLPSGQVVLLHVAKSVVAPPRSELVRSAPVRFAAVRFAVVRSVSFRLASDRFAPFRFAPTRPAQEMSAPFRFAPYKFAPPRLAPLSITPDRSQPFAHGGFTNIALTKFSTHDSLWYAPSSINNDGSDMRLFLRPVNKSLLF